MIFNTEVERIVLGEILLESHLYYEHADLIDAECFFDDVNKLIYESIKSVAVNSKIDTITVIDKARQLKDKLPKHLRESELNIPYYVASLTMSIGGTYNFDSHLSLLHEYKKRRELCKIEKYINDSIRKEKTNEEIIEYINSSMLKVSDVSIKHEQSIDQCLENFTILLNSRMDENLTPTYINEVDRVIGGIEKSDLVIIAGASSMGKTSFALKLMNNFIIKDKKVMMFTLEMNSNQLMSRLISMRTGISLKRLRYKDIDDIDKEKIRKEMMLMKGKLFWIDETSSKLTQIISKIKKYKLTKGLDFIFIDYLQLVSHSDVSVKSREQEVATIARTLKNIAKELGIGVIALSQLNRSLASRDNKRPIMSDLRESGEIEQAADTIMFAYREAYYNGDTSPIQEAEIIVGKGRNSGVGTAVLKFIPEQTKFLSPIDDYDEIDKQVPSIF